MTLELFANRELLRYAVGRQIWCPHTKTCLDVRTAVLVDAKRGGETVSSTVLAGDAWDKISTTALARLAEMGLDVEVIDGRVVNA